jgi:uncharacterized membrane protein YccC
LAQAERIRLSILMLGRVRIRWRRDADSVEKVAMMDECFRAASQILVDIAALLAGRHTRPDAEPAALHECAERLRLVATGEALHYDASAEAARRQIEALAGQLRSALDLATSSTEAGQIVFERIEAMRPWRLRLEGILATLRANATPQSSAFRHAIRLSGSVVAGEAAAYMVGEVRSYWLPMTVAIVLRSDFRTTFTRGALRLAATLAGLIIATALFHLAAPTSAAVIAFSFVTAFILRCFGPANYAIIATAVKCDHRPVVRPQRAVAGRSDKAARMAHAMGRPACSRRVW